MKGEYDSCLADTSTVIHNYSGCRPKSHTGLVCDMSNNEVENGKIIEEFAKAGRTGRRNALPDVFSIPHASCGTAGLTAALEQLQTSAGKSKRLRHITCYWEYRRIGLMYNCFMRFLPEQHQRSCVLCFIYLIG